MTTSTHILKGCFLKLLLRDNRYICDALFCCVPAKKEEKNFSIKFSVTNINIIVNARFLLSNNCYVIIFDVIVEYLSKENTKAN